MRWYPRLLVSLLVLAFACCGFAVELDGPKQVAVGERFDVSVNDFAIPLSAFSKTPPQMEWKALCGDVNIRSRLEMKTEVVNGKPVWVASPYATVVSQTAGKIAIVLMVVQDGVGSLAVLEVTVGPFPDPQPDPTPEPNPQPEPGKRWILLIEETSQRHLHPGLSNLIVSPDFREYLSGKGHQFRAWDKDLAQMDNAPSEALPWFSRVGDNVPCLLIVTEDGQILYEGPPIVSSVDDAITHLKSFGG